MRLDLGAKLAGQQLGAKAHAEKRNVAGERHLEPVDLLADEIEFLAVVGAHRTAENDHAAMLIEAFGQRLAEARAANIEPKPAFLELQPDPAGGRGRLMDDDQNLAAHRNNPWVTSPTDRRRA
jgi:hypothetical protein